MNLKELSEKLGLSQTTVSRALNGFPEVSEATRLRVEQASRNSNYKPNSRAKGLATGKSMAIGHVIPVSAKHEMVNPVFGDFIAGAGEAYSKKGYDLILSLVEDGSEERVYREMHSKGAVDGIILHGPRMADARIALLQEIGIPFLVHGRASSLADNYSWLDVNNEGAFLRATEFLLALDHRRIALVNGLEHLDFAYWRRNGFVSALRDAGIAADPDLMFSNEMTEVYGYQSAQFAFEHKDPPTAFLCSSMISAIGVRRALYDRGLELGKDISVITFDDELSYLANGSDVPIFTAVRSSVRAAGLRSAEMLLDIIQTPGVVPQHQLFEVELVVGQSTGRCPERA